MTKQQEAYIITQLNQILKNQEEMIAILKQIRGNTQ